MKAAARPPRRAALEERALVLRRFRYGESSLVAHLLTPGQGRVAVLAKGAYRLKSGFFGVLDLFDTLRVGFRAQGGELGLVASASIERRRRGVTRSLAAYRAALCVLEVAGMGARAGTGEPELFALAEGALDLLDLGRTPPALVRAAFDLAFLEQAGLAPALEACASCGAPPARGGRAASVPFSVSGGGRLCERCADEARARGRRIETVPLQQLRIASSLMAAPAAGLERVRLEEATLARLLAFVERFLEYHLETRPRAWERGAARTARRRAHGSPPRPRDDATR